MITLERPSEKILPSYLDFVGEMRQLGETVCEGTFPAQGESGADFVRGLLVSRCKKWVIEKLPPAMLCTPHQPKSVTGKI